MLLEARSFLCNSSFKSSFCHVSQDEKQRQVTSLHQNVEAVAFANHGVFNQQQFVKHTNSNNQGQRNNKPICSYCGITGNKKDKRYKLDGYPPGHHLAKKSPINASADQVYASDCSEVLLNLSNITITPNQCQQIISMLKPQLEAFICCKSCWKTASCINTFFNDAFCYSFLR